MIKIKSTLEIKSPSTLVSIESISVLRTRGEVAAMIENDHRAEIVKYKNDAIDGL